MRIVFLTMLVVLLALAFAAPAGAVACGAADGTPVEDGCLFTITGGDTPDPNDGFAVTDSGGVPLWSCYQTLDLRDVGYPITQRFQFQNFTLQAFQKVILQYRPERAGSSGCGPFDYLNTLDLLQNAYGGLELPFLPPHRALPEDSDAQGNPKPWPQIVANHLGLVEQHPNFAARFDEQRVPNWLNLYGLPISYQSFPGPDGEPIAEALRAQRANFIWWFKHPNPALNARIDLQSAPDEVKKRFTDVIIPQSAKNPVSKAFAEGLVPPRQLATGLHGYGIQGEFRQPNDGRLADLVQEAGLGWVKQQIPWSEVENAGGYFWDATDRFVSTMNGKGLNILMSVVKAPDFYKADPAKVGTTHGRPADPTKFRTFMRELASRYRGRVQAYEIWNEENFEREWGVLGPAAYGQFVELLKNGYIGAKQGDPNAIIVLGAPTPTGVNDPNIGIDDLIYLQRVFAYNGGEVGNYFEALGVHPNGGPNSPRDTNATSNQHVNPNPTGNSWRTCGGGWTAHSSFYFDRYKELYQAMLNAGITGKTIWLTEFGWASAHGPGAPPSPSPGYEYAGCNTEQDQADFITQAFERIRTDTHPAARHVTHMFVWNLNFQEVVPNTDEKWAFGIVRSDLSPRPAFNALKAVPKPQVAVPPSG